MSTFTLAYYESFLNWQKILGIIPYKIAHPTIQNVTTNVNNGENKVNNNKVNHQFQNPVYIDFYKRSSNPAYFFYWHLIIAAFFFTYLLFQLIRFFQKWFEGLDLKELMGLTCWFWKPIFVGTFLIHFHLNQERIRKFHNDWIEVESRIYEAWNSAAAPLEPSILKERRRFYLPLNFSTVVLVVTAAINHLTAPTIGLYFSSLVPSALWFSVCLQLFHFLPIYGIFHYFYVLCFAFSRSISRILVLISDVVDSRSSVPPDFAKVIFHTPKEHAARAIGIMEMVLVHYKMLEKLMEEFNSIYRWILLFYKSLILINLSIVIFVALRFITILRVSSVLVFFISFAFLLFHVATLLPSLGSVVEKTGQFRLVCLRKLGNSQEGLFLDAKDLIKMRSELDSCEGGFGFQVGSFYVVGPASLLTFLSIVITYLVVLLQFQ